MNKKIVIGIPTIDLHEMTGKFLSTTASYVFNKKDVTFVIVDNASEKPYEKVENPGELGIDLITNEMNLGYYYPLLQLYEKYPEADYIGLMHNDTVIFQEKWDERVCEAFEKDPKLGALGLFGWQQLSSTGRNEMTLGNIYRGENSNPPTPQVFSQWHRRVYTPTPALVLDSLFMVFRREVIPLLGIDENITISHGYDKIWSLRLIQQGWRVAVAGIPFLHQGGDDKDLKIKKMFKEWFDKRWDVNSPLEWVYHIAFFETQVLLVNEFRDRGKMIPCRIDDEYNIQDYNAELNKISHNEYVGAELKDI